LLPSSPSVSNLSSCRPAAGDNQLIAWMQDGNVAAFDVLYQRYKWRAHRVARAVTRDRSDAEEAVQDAFRTVWTSRAAYRPDRPTAAAWLLTIVRNRAIDATRREASRQRLAVSDAGLELRPAVDDVAGEAVDRILACELRRLLGRLPDPQREVLTLAFYGQLSQTEIAVRLGLPLGTIKARARRGLAALRVELEGRA
jgi:RNA polymerase sigma-70 factor, ECF subfamily